MIRDTILYKPITVLLLLMITRTLTYGWGFFISSPSVLNLPVWMYILETGLNPVVFGGILVVIAIISIYGLFFLPYRVTNILLTLQSLVWLYVAICYWLNGGILIGIVTGLIPCMIFGYLNFIFVNFSSSIPKRKKNTPAI